LATLSILDVSAISFDEATTALAVTFSVVRNARWAAIIFRIAFTTLGTGFVRAFVIRALEIAGHSVIYTSYCAVAVVACVLAQELAKPFVASHIPLQRFALAHGRSVYSLAF
jgi:hypothetical protein